jgi:hypothetical protein
MSRAARQHGSVLRPALSALLSTSAPGHFAKDLLPVCSTLPALCNAVAAPHARRSLLRDTHKSPRSARTAPHPDAQQQRVSVAPSSHTQLIADIDRKAASHLRGATYTHRLSSQDGPRMVARNPEVIFWRLMQVFRIQGVAFRHRNSYCFWFLGITVVRGALRGRGRGRKGQKFFLEEGGCGHRSACASGWRPGTGRHIGHVRGRARLLAAVRAGLRSMLAVR